MLPSKRGADTGSRAVAVRLIQLIGLAVLLYCGNATSSDDSPVPSPSYSWRGRILDSVTRIRVGNTTFVIREQAALEAGGLFPFLIVEYYPDHRFVADYTLHGFRCRGAVDTSLMLHLQIVDSLGRYRPAEHESSWLVNCRERPGGPPQPYPMEDSLVILLQPVP